MSEFRDDEFIGVATMTDDGTITLKLLADGPGVYGYGVLKYPKEHEQYEEILEHIGPMKPGEEVKVRPWPD